MGSEAHQVLYKGIASTCTPLMITPGTGSGKQIPSDVIRLDLSDDGGDSPEHWLLSVPRKGLARCVTLLTLPSCCSSHCECVSETGNLPGVPV